MNSSAPSPQTQSSPAVQAWRRFAEQAVEISETETQQVIRDFEPEIHRYSERWHGPQGGAKGILLRGDGAPFSEKVLGWMKSWDISEANQQHFQALAQQFEHTNSFLKLAWEPEEGRELNVWYRRRPPLRRVLHHYYTQGIETEALQRILWLSRVLDQDNVHFIGAAYRKGMAPLHQIHFTQRSTPQNYTTIVQRLLALLDHFDIPAAMKNQFFLNHALRCPPQLSTTLYLAFSFHRQGLAPSFRIDYAEVPLEGIAEEHRLADAPISRIDYLGMRYFPDRPTLPAFHFQLK